MRKTNLFLFIAILLPTIANAEDVQNPFLGSNIPVEAPQVKAEEPKPEKTEDKKTEKIEGKKEEKVAESLFQQRLFTFKIDADYANVAGSQALEGPVNFIAKKINPNAGKLIIPSFTAKGEVPISVVTDANGDLKAVVIGEDGKNIELVTNGKKDELRQYAIYVSPEDAAQKRIKIDASSPLRDQHELFYLDASNLKAKEGGTIKIRYVSSLLTGGTNALDIKLSRVGSLWAASTDDSVFSRFVRNERYIKEAKISPNMLKMGLGSPDFVFAEGDAFVGVEREAPKLTEREILARIDANKENLRSLASQINGKTRFQNMDFELRYSEPSAEQAQERKLAPIEDRSVSAAN